MTKKYIRIAELIYKDKIGELTEREKNELLAWLEESDFNRQIFDELAKGSSLSRSYDEYRNIHREQVWRDRTTDSPAETSIVIAMDGICGIRNNISGWGTVDFPNVR